MNKILLASITFALIAAAPPSAEATTLSFDSILSVGNYVAFVATDQYRESGYQLSLNGPYGFSTVQTNDPRFTGKAAIFKWRRFTVPRSFDSPDTNRRITVLFRRDLFSATERWPLCAQ